ncbi:ATP adenylyltransferase family protein [Brasilonema bromeliae]|uniref:Phosphorylase n=1 Tax=Brasilonema bromeliae SPC951 TaxID=385972 RepID=A0ABX1P3W2_9CYAN|nr:phosphorylase [Brasilonema bromeliae]NMG19050.1 phosphorylase [Brasilonema bromeliae SPC951]
MPEEKQTIHEEILLKPGTLWKRVKEQTEYALQCGALLTIPTEFEFIEQDGVRFLVRVLSNLVRKEAVKQKQQTQTSSGQEFNPFLPYEEDLFVAEISQTHVCILNKFNVTDYHLLLITRAFEEQETLLTLQDFAAMWACLAEFDGLVFYNAGKIAGASQRHKHLQLVPLPLIPNGLQIPVEPLFAFAEFQDCVATIPQLPFVHAFTKLDPLSVQSPLKAAEVTLSQYRTLLHAVGLENSGKQSGAYNLLATREWMLIVPRSAESSSASPDRRSRAAGIGGATQTLSHESFESIAVNSLGFAGSLFVRNEQQMQILKDVGPMTLLQKVAVATK